MPVNLDLSDKISCNKIIHYLLLPHISQMSSRALFRYVQAWHSHRAEEDDDVEGAAAAVAATAATLGGERCRLWRELLFLF